MCTIYIECKWKRKYTRRLYSSLQGAACALVQVRSVKLIGKGPAKHNSVDLVKISRKLVANLPELSVLHLENVAPKQDLYRVAKVLVGATALSALTLRNCDGKSITGKFVKELGSLRALTHFDISDTNVEHSCIVCLGCLSALTYLSLSLKEDMPLEVMESWMKYLSGLSTLTHLNLSGKATG